MESSASVHPYMAERGRFTPSQIEHWTFWWLKYNDWNKCTKRENCHKSNPVRICKGNSNKSQTFPVKDANTEQRLRGIKAYGKEGMGVGSASLKLLSAQGETKQSPCRGLREKTQKILSFACTSILNEARACDCPALSQVPNKFCPVASGILRNGSEDIVCQASFPVHSTHRTTLLWWGGGC